MIILGPVYSSSIMIILGPVYFLYCAYQLMEADCLARGCVFIFEKYHNLVTFAYFYTQRRTLQHGTTTASYSGPFAVESSVEFARVIGMSTTSTVSFRGFKYFILEQSGNEAIILPHLHYMLCTHMPSYPQFRLLV